MLVKATKRLVRIGYCGPFMRWLTRVPLGIAMLVGFLMFDATAAEAVPVRVDTVFVDVTTEAFFDDAARGGPGSGDVDIPIDEYRLNFSSFGPALADLSSPPPGLFATFTNGVFRYISGGPVPFVSPPSPSNFHSLFLEPPGLNRLVLRFRISGRNNFALISQSGTIPLTPPTVPEPGTIALFVISLVGLGVTRRRRNAV